MGRGWAGAAGLLFLAACRSGSGASSERSAAERRPSAEVTRPASDAPRGCADPERDAATARTLAAIRRTGRNEIALAELTGRRSPGAEARELAARILAERRADLDALARFARERSLDLDALDADPLILADQAAGRDALDRLARVTGPELDALYAALEAASAMRLSRLADQAEALARDPDAVGALRRLAFQGRDAQARAFAILPRACGGQREAKAAGPPRPNGASAPALLGL